jgi:hypothetical protein
MVLPMGEIDFGSPPDVPFEAVPSVDEIELFHENGFLAVERITTDEEIEWLTRIYEHVFDGDQAAGPDRPLDRSGLRQPEVAGKLTQFFHPEVRFPELLQSLYFRNAKRYAAALLDEKVAALTVWSHMIRKAPGGREVRPHQDEAFWPPDYDYRNIAVWLPLHDVSLEMGAMQYVPGSHRRGLLKHRHYDDPSQNLLMVDEADDLLASVPCPLRKGGCTFHHPATVHQTAVNTTDRPRLAFPLTVQTTPVRRDSRRETPWLDEFAAAIGGRRQTTYLADGKVLHLPA